MKLTKALKLKNKMVRELTTQKEQMSNSNSYNKLNPPKYDSREKYDTILKGSMELALHKANIAQANHNIYYNMFLMAEYKGLISTLKNMSTREGIEKTPSFRGDPIDTTFIAVMDQKEIDEKVKFLTEEIERLQDLIDEHNATHSID